jgi:[acyl-carrier-protein] S-malonyltransferase
MSQTAFLFPGQGSQAVGMLADLADEAAVRQTFREAADALGYDLWGLIQNGPDEELNRTDCTQPALLASSVALWRLWTERGGARPDWLAGHSLGEYSALVCADALSLADGVRLVANRGRFMQEAVPAGQGAMAAILGLDDDQVIAVCRDAAGDEVVEAVNFNAPGQVVIAGNAGAVDRAIAAAKEAGAKRAMGLPVSVPSHCELMQPAAERLREELENTRLQAPSIPVVNNVDVAVEEDPAAIRDALVRQLYSPVRWSETVRWLLDQGVEQSYECGPGKVLAGLVKRVERRAKAQPLGDREALDAAQAS